MDCIETSKLTRKTTTAHQSQSQFLSRCGGVQFREMVDPDFTQNFGLVHFPLICSQQLEMVNLDFGRKTPHQSQGEPNDGTPTRTTFSRRHGRVLTVYPSLPPSSSEISLSHSLLHSNPRWRRRRRELCRFFSPTPLF
ncbi:hypothetical protein AQUCO_00400043v1 [Aquilegia coerulea]|uniref:Uncharacterized protein n=1 Tax=Aquilegia coerulea TaxID=218851 RepID=A0A2G5ET40_AQUCA|nr:hypothetical protein AQUCO_00400043v1 [Aquilegia coerulea]